MPPFTSVSETIDHFSDRPIVDEEQIEMLRMVDEDDSGGGLVAELYGLFHQESSEKLKTLGDVCAANDRVQFRKIIHFIAGSAGNIGFMRLNLALRAVEEGIDTDQIMDITQAEAPVQDLFNHSCQYLVSTYNL